MDAAKIRLSPEEMELVSNAGWILTKNRIVEKAKELLAGLQDDMTACVQAHAEKLPAGIHGVSPKISKGENYKGLPWLMLDYPRLFDKVDTFAVRTMFWWGNFFSITLQLRGKYKDQFAEKIAGSVEQLAGQHFFYCINEDEWEHHFEPSNYIPVSGLSAAEFEKTLVQASFIKIAKRISLDHWQDVPANILVDFRLIIGLLSA